MRKRISTGGVFRQTYRDRRGRLLKTSAWPLKYYVKGKPVQFRAVPPERVRMDQLFDLLLNDYRYKERKSTYDTELRIKSHLRPSFGAMKAQAVGSRTRRQYVELRLRQHAENATINKELSFVRRAMKLWAHQDPPLVLRVSHFEMLPVDNMREGTVEHEPYRALRDALPEYARIALVIAYDTGARKARFAASGRTRWI